MVRHNTGQSAGRRSRLSVAWRSLVILAGLVFLSAGCSPTVSTPPAPTAGVEANVKHWKGNLNAKVIVEEWTDLQ